MLELQFPFKIKLFLTQPLHFTSNISHLKVTTYLYHVLSKSNQSKSYSSTDAVAVIGSYKL